MYVYIIKQKIYIYIYILSSNLLGYGWIKCKPPMYKIDGFSQEVCGASLFMKGILLFTILGYTILYMDTKQLLLLLL